jgi:hypothetical protein
LLGAIFVYHGTPATETGSIIFYGAATALTFWRFRVKHQAGKAYDALHPPNAPQAPMPKIMQDAVIHAEPHVFFGLPDEERSKHVWICGMSGYGKSNFLFYLTMFDIISDKGVTVIDPGGDLVKELLQHIPKSRLDDVILLDLENAIPLDFMNCATDKERELLVGDLMKTFRRLSEMAGGQWGVRMDAILRDVLYTLLNATNVSFVDIHYFLTSKKRRAEILAQPTIPPDLKERWETRFPHEEAIEPIISRMSSIIRTKSLHAVFGTPNARLNIGDAMRDKKIVLVDIGGATESGVMFGSMLVSKYQQAAFRRANIPAEERVPHYLFVDEFANFQSSEFDTILSQGRKFQICLTVANQWVSQLSTEIRSAVFGGISTWFLFRTSPEDLPTFSGHIPPLDMKEFTGYRDAEGTLHGEGIPIPFDVARLGKLDIGTAIQRHANGKASIVLIPSPAPLPEDPDQAHYAAYIKKRTVELYACTPPAESVKSTQDDRRTEPPKGPPKNIPKHQRPT